MRQPVWECPVLTIGRWRSRLIRSGVDGLLDEPRPGAPRKISDAAVEKAVTLTLESKPRDATHWSTRSLAKRVGLSRSSVARIWRAFGLRPHRSESFKLSTDPLLIEKVRDIVGLYLDPPDRAVVLCVDEKPQIQALDRSQPILPLQPGQIERRTHDYVRCGTTSLFAALNVKSGKVIAEHHRRHHSPASSMGWSQPRRSCPCTGQSPPRRGVAKRRQFNRRGGNWPSNGRRQARR